MRVRGGGGERAAGSESESETECEGETETESETESETEGRCEEPTLDDPDQRRDDGCEGGAPV